VHVYTTKCVPGAQADIRNAVQTRATLALLHVHFCLPGNLADRINLRATDQQGTGASQTALQRTPDRPTAEKALAFCVAACPPAVALYGRRTSLDRQARSVKVQALLGPVLAWSVGLRYTAAWWDLFEAALQQAVGEHRTLWRS
jgi:hypothetical protein